jgi:hypothetical protein
MALEYVPEKFRNKNLYRSAVQQTGEALRHVPEPLRNKEICLSAVKQDGLALCYVPPQLRDREICQEALGQDREAWEHIPDQLHDMFPKPVEVLCDWTENLAQLKFELSREPLNNRHIDIQKA